MLYRFSSFGVQKPKLHREHRGTIVDTDDPLKLGRVRATIDGIYSEQDKDKLPWIATEQPYEHSGNEKEANFHVPRKGAVITVKFKDGDRYHPFYTSSWRSKNNTALEPFMDNYPYTSGTVTRNGNQTLHNLTDGSSVYKHYAVKDDPNSDDIDDTDHSNSSGGTKFATSRKLGVTQPSEGNSEDKGQQPKFTHSIDALGSVIQKSVKDLTTDFKGNSSSTVGGDKSESVSGQSSMSSVKDMIMNTAQNMIHKAGSDILHQATSDIKNLATKILLN